MPPTIEVIGHPLRALDPVEARTFSRDLLLAQLYIGTDPTEVKLWLATRTRARRDLLWYCRNIHGLDRLTEEKHRPPADRLMHWIRTPHSFGNYRDPRGNGKSSLSTRGGTTWCLVQDPIECVERGWPTRGRESRLRLITLKAPMTEDFMRLILADLASETLRWAFPEIIPDKPSRWSVKGIDVRRGLTDELSPFRDNALFSAYPPPVPFLDSSVAPGSLEAGAAGAHPQGIFIDDPVNEATWNSEVNIQNAIHGIRQTFNLGRPEQAFRICTGNHWVSGDPADIIDQEDANWEVFMRSMDACEECKDGYPLDERGIPERRPDLQWAHQHKGPVFTWLMQEADGSDPDPAKIFAGCATKHIAMAQYNNAPYAAESTMWDSHSLPTFRFAEMTHHLDPPSLGWKIEFLHTKTRELYSAPVSSFPRGVAYDPAHGSETGKSVHALASWARTPDDRYVWLEGRTWPSEQSLEALDGLVETIFRLKPYRVGVESIGYQNVIRDLLWRELLQPRTPCCFVRPDEPPRPHCRKHNPKKEDLVRSSLSEEGIVKVSRSKVRKVDDVRDTLGPLINSRALLLGDNSPGAQAIRLALDVFPVTIHDLADVGSFMPRLFDPRPPSSLADRERRRRIRRRRLARRTATSGVSGYGKYGL